MKSLLLLLATATLAHSATIITSTVTPIGDVFRYTYRAQSQVGKHDVSNITIPVCDAFDEFGDDHFTLDRKDGSLKFDSIRPAGPEFVFGFSSHHPPVEGVAAVKAGRIILGEAVRHPACVPEPSALMFCAVFFAVALTIRRR